MPGEPAAAVKAERKGGLDHGCLVEKSAKTPRIHENSRDFLWVFNVFSGQKVVQKA